MWKIQDFSVIQIFCEINFIWFRSSELAFLQFWRLWICWFGRFQHCKITKIYEKSKFRDSKCVKRADFSLLETPKLISRKISVTKKSYFHTVLLSRFFYKDFVKAEHLLRKLLISWFHEIFFYWDLIFLFFHTVTFTANGKGIIWIHVGDPIEQNKIMYWERSILFSFLS